MESKREMDKIIGANIKRERESAGFTQERFSEMIGLGVKSLSAAERGVVGISISTLRKICTVLAVPGDRILFGSAEEQDFGDMTERLHRLSPQQAKIVNSVIGNLLEAFTLGTNSPGD